MFMCVKKLGKVFDILMKFNRNFINVSKKIC